MDSIRTTKAIACLLLVMTLFSAGAADNENEELMQKGMWKDPATGLIWSRCSIGSVWQDNKCTGSPQLFNSQRHSRESTLRAAREHRLGGFTDWRLPSIAELLTLRTCQPAMSDSRKDIPFEDGAILKTFERCTGELMSIDTEIFPDYKLGQHGHYYGHWASLYSNGVGLRWQAYFGSYGHFLERQFEHYAGYVRPVRAPTESNAAVAAVFARQLEAQSALALQERRSREAQAAREAELRRQADAEDERRRQAEAKAFETLLNARDPQAMYLAAGRLERNGQSTKAQQVYERLIERFPSTTWAVKANDQLLETRRVNSQNSAIQDVNADARARAVRMCRLEMDSCYSRGGSNCYRNCDSLR